MVPLLLAESTGSTNDELWARFAMGLREPLAFLALTQSGGRGRRGGRWYSQAPGNLHLSVLLFGEPSLGPTLPFLPLGAALVAARVIRDRTGVQLTIKWPNDLVTEGKKVGGILVETRSPASGPVPVVFGFGVNLNDVPSDCPPGSVDVLQTMSRMCGRRVPLLDIALEIIYTLEVWFGSLSA